MSELEKQLRASLTGRPTAVLDYARVQVAMARVKIAMDQMGAALAEITVSLGERPATEHLADAIRSAARAEHDMGIAIKRMPT